MKLHLVVLTATLDLVTIRIKDSRRGNRTFENVRLRIGKERDEKLDARRKTVSNPWFPGRDLASPRCHRIDWRSNGAWREEKWNRGERARANGGIGDDCSALVLSATQRVLSVTTVVKKTKKLGGNMRHEEGNYNNPSRLTDFNVFLYIFICVCMCVCVYVTSREETSSIFQLKALRKLVRFLRSILHR